MGLGGAIPWRFHHFAEKTELKWYGEQVLTEEINLTEEITIFFRTKNLWRNGMGSIAHRIAREKWWLFFPAKVHAETQGTVATARLRHGPGREPPVFGVHEVHGIAMVSQGFPGLVRTIHSGGYEPGHYMSLLRLFLVVM